MINVFAAEELEQALENASKSEAFAGGTVFGMALGTAVIIGLIWFILEVIADWKIFVKAGRPGWKSIIPFLNSYEEYELSWKGKGALGLIVSLLLCAMQTMDVYLSEPWPAWAAGVMSVVGICVLVFSAMQNLRLAKAFGKGKLFFIGLLLLSPLFRMILGFGNAEYRGAQP